MSDFTRYAERFLTNVRHDASVNAKLAAHLERLVFNLTSLVATVALLKGSKKIATKHVELAGQYVLTSCGKVVAGGNALGSSEWYGQSSGSYGAASAADGAAASTVDFLADSARPALGMQAGGGDSTIIPLAAIMSMVKSHQIAISESARAPLRRLIESRLTCLSADLMRQVGKSGITDGKLDKVLALKRHAVFH